MNGCFEIVEESDFQPETSAGTKSEIDETYFEALNC